MKILGITTEYEGGAAAVEDGRLVAAVNEERLCRIKLAAGFPRQSIPEVLALADWKASDLDCVLVAGDRDIYLGEPAPFHGWFEFRPQSFGRWLKRSVGARVARFRDLVPWLEPAYYLLLGPSFRRRQKIVTRNLREDYGISCPIRFVDHHFCHIASAYFTSGMSDALIVSLDGGGDGKSGRVYAARNGQFEELHSTSAYNSLGNYYAYVTHLCGFKAHRHEGKITGLAAYGEPVYLQLLEEFIQEADGRFHNVGGVVFEAAVAKLDRRLPSDWKREDLAASIQLHFEQLVARHVGYWAEAAGLRNVALAGGVFANVRVNQVLHELSNVDEVFVHPGMGDGGLAVGAALAASVDGVADEKMAFERETVSHVYLGPDLDTASIERALAEHGLVPESLLQWEGLEDGVAALLAEGHVVARAAGRMEYGPRALGNRSILYQPADQSVNDWLNDNLKRTEFMPFAPSVLWEERDRCFDGLAGAENSAQFMTVTFRCTEWMRQAMPGVVHIDGTARPQLVKRSTNPGYYEILSAFHRRTGLPGIVNTSFNMHEEPIVSTASDCVRAFLAAKLDFLAIGPYLVRHPEGHARDLKRVVAHSIPAGRPEAGQLVN